MTYLRLIREPSSGGATLGTFYMNDVYQCWSLEDVIREPAFAPAADLDRWVWSWKVPHETAIPQGRYQVGLTMSKRFGMVLPEIMNVPGYTGIRIHAGNIPADTDGCVVVGHTRAEHQVLESRFALNGLMQKLKAVASEPMVIDIENPRGLHLTVEQLERSQ